MHPIFALEKIPVWKAYQMNHGHLKVILNAMGTRRVECVGWSMGQHAARIQSSRYITALVEVHPGYFAGEEIQLQIVQLSV